APACVAPTCLHCGELDLLSVRLSVFFFTAPAAPEIYTLSLHDALPISRTGRFRRGNPDLGFEGAWQYEFSVRGRPSPRTSYCQRSEEHTSELQSRGHLVCRLLLEKKKKKKKKQTDRPIKYSGATREASS